MNILLVNPNKMNQPPVIPIGLEYVYTALKDTAYHVDVLDLCFSENPERKLEMVLENNHYDLIGFTIRNVDSSLYFNNEFYLPKIKKLVDIAKKKRISVILGGAGFSSMPKQILEFLGGDYGISGPGEFAFLDLTKNIEKGKKFERITNGHKYNLNNKLIHKRGNLFDYKAYIGKDGIVGFQTQTGCMGKCPYCLEANKKVSFREIDYILQEIEYLVEQSYTHFHTCDSEFNNNLEFSIEFCKKLIERNLGIKWALYMKPTPYNEELYSLLHETGAYLVTLTVDSDERIQKLNKYGYEDIAKIINLCQTYQIKLAIDLLTGYPGESLESTKRAINFFKKHRPYTVGIGFYFRIHKNTPLAELIKNNPKFQELLTGSYPDDDNLVEPIFYSQYSLEEIQDLINEDDLFKIAGIVPGVNYQQ